jgi:hypothetical protein
MNTHRFPQTHTDSHNTHTDSPSPHIKRLKAATPSPHLHVSQSPYGTTPDGTKPHSPSSYNPNGPDKYKLSPPEVSKAGEGKTHGNVSKAGEGKTHGNVSKAGEGKTHGNVSKAGEGKTHGSVLVYNNKTEDTHRNGHESGGKDTASKAHRSSIVKSRIVPKVEARSANETEQHIINIDDDSASPHRVSSGPTQTHARNVQPARRRSDDDVCMIEDSPSERRASNTAPHRDDSGTKSGASNAAPHRDDSNTKSASRHGAAQGQTRTNDQNDQTRNNDSESRTNDQTRNNDSESRRGEELAHDDRCVCVCFFLHEVFLFARREESEV